MKFEDAILELLELKREMPKSTLVVLGQLSGLSKKQAIKILNDMLEEGTLYVARRELIIKVT